MNPLFTVVTLKLGDMKNHPTQKLSDSNVTLNLGDMMGHVSLLLSEAIVHIRGRVLYSSFVPEGHKTNKMGEEGSFGLQLKVLKGFFPEGMFPPLFEGWCGWGGGELENLF